MKKILLRMVDCGSLFQGICTVRSFRNISHVEHLIKVNIFLIKTRDSNFLIKTWDSNFLIKTRDSNFLIRTRDSNFLIKTRDRVIIIRPQNNVFVEQRNKAFKKLHA